MLFLAILTKFATVSLPNMAETLKMQIPTPKL